LEAVGRIVVAVDDGSVMLAAGEGKTVSFSSNWVRSIHGQPGGTYSMVEWVAEPGIPGTPLHIHAATDEAFYVLEGTFGFQAGERTFEGEAGAFVFVPKGLEHAYWNAGMTQAKMLITISPPGFERYFEELAEGLAQAGEDAEAAMRVRKGLSEKYDIEVVGPPRQATT
jgi:quercetin dioxygenase-like cupin family protein